MRFFRLPVIIGALPVALTNGTTADATQVMSDLNWIVNQVNANAAPLATAALTNANNNFTAVQSGQAATAAANFPIASQIQSSVFTTFQSTLGTNNLTARMAALALTTWPTDGVFTFIPSQTNNGPASISVDSAGSSIIFSMGSTLVGGELRAGVPAELKRDATRLNLTNPANVRFDLASSATGGGVRVLISATPVPIALGKQPTTTTLASGSGTYNPPAGCVRIEVELVGGGGGGAPPNTNDGGNGGDTTFSGAGISLTGSGGTGGKILTSSNASGGAATGGDLNFAGGQGQAGDTQAVVGNQPAGGQGGSSYFGGNGGGGGSGQAGGNAAANSGSGGGGAGQNGNISGGGGGAGGYVWKRINFPAPGYSYSVGALGAGGTAGAGANGGNGAAGVIFIQEFYS